MRWYLRSAAREFGIPARHIEPVRAAFSRGDGVVPRWDASGRSRIAGTLPRISAASLALIDWSCRQRWALTLYQRIPARWRHRLRRKLEHAAFVPAAPDAPATPLPVAAPRASDGLNLVGYARGEFGVAEILRNFAAMLRHGDLPFCVRNVEIDISSYLALDFVLHTHYFLLFLHPNNFVAAERRWIRREVRDGMGTVAEELYGVLGAAGREPSPKPAGREPSPKPAGREPDSKPAGRGEDAARIRNG